MDPKNTKTALELQIKPNSGEIGEDCVLLYCSRGKCYRLLWLGGIPIYGARQVS